jgi:hypothetical protein
VGPAVLKNNNNNNNNIAVPTSNLETIILKITYYCIQLKILRKKAVAASAKGTSRETDSVHMTIADFFIIYI